MNFRLTILISMLLLASSGCRGPSRASAVAPAQIDTAAAIEAYVELLRAGGDSMLMPVKITCPMPVVRPDSTLRDSMVVARADSTSRAITGVHRPRCRNPLFKGP